MSVNARGMSRSEFTLAVNQVYGSAYGTSLLQDLVLEPWGKTAQQALAGGHEPVQIWQELLRQTDKDVESLAFPHRAPQTESK